MSHHAQHHKQPQTTIIQLLMFIIFFVQHIYIDLFEITQSRMKTNNYQCVNCQLHFEVEEEYITHYKSEHHRYNIKRKLIGLPPLSFEEYNLQFEDQKTSKQSVQQDFYCEICSKKFANSGTYKQHISSKKHKLNRDHLKAPEKYAMSKSSSSSDFEIIGAERAETCLFCQAEGTVHHLRMVHNFPPFESECTNKDGLIAYLKDKIKKFECVYCHMKFSSEESVKQHMADLSHSKIDIESFGQFQRFYLWKILESSSEEEEQELHMLSPQKKQQENSMFEQLNHPTLEQLQQKRLDRIQYTATGAIINGKQVGYRFLKQYYKQYLNRVLPNPKQKYQHALTQKSEWDSNHSRQDRVSKLKHIVQSR